MFSRAGLGPSTEAHGDAVPGVHQGDGVCDVDNLPVLIVACQRFVGSIRGMRRRDVGQCLCPFKCSLLSIRKVRALPPSGEPIEAFIGLTGPPQVSRMLMDTVQAAVDLRDAQEEKINEALVESGTQQSGIDLGQHCLLYTSDAADEL